MRNLGNGNSLQKIISDEAVVKFEKFEASKDTELIIKVDNKFQCSCCSRDQTVFIALIIWMYLNC